MYDQGQYSNNLYHQIDDEGRPIMVLNEPPFLYRIPRDAEFNPITLLQVVESDWTHIGQEKVWSQEPLNMTIDPKRVVYPPFMIERPYYIEPTTQTESLLFNYGTGNFSAQTMSNSLFSKDLGMMAAIRANTTFVGKPLVNLPHNKPDATLRLQSQAYALQSLMDYNPMDVHIKTLYIKYQNADLNDNTFMEILRPLPLAGFLKTFLYQTNTGEGENRMRWYSAFGHAGRMEEFNRLGGQIFNEGFLRRLQGVSRQDAFFFWLFMPHSAKLGEGDQNYETTMMMISNFVLTGRWASPSEYKEPYVMTGLVNGENPAWKYGGNALDTLARKGVDQLAGDSAAGKALGNALVDEAGNFIKTAKTSGVDAAGNEFRDKVGNTVDAVRTAASGIGNSVGL